MDKYLALLNPGGGALVSARATSQRATARAMRTLGVGGGAFLAGAITTKLGGDKGKDFWGLPASLAIALGFWIASATDLGGSYSDDLANMGDGAFAGYMHSVGRSVGTGKPTLAVGDGGSDGGGTFQRLMDDAYGRR